MKLTILQLAKELTARGLHASPWTVRRRVHRGELRHSEISTKGAYLFDVDDAMRQWLRGPEVVAA